MKNIIQWIKSNPITVLSALVILGSLGFAGYIWATQAGQLKDDIAKLGDATKKARQFQGNTIELPPPALDQAPITISGVTYNEATVEQMKQIYARLNGQAAQASGLISQINQRGHGPIMADFFPAASGDAFIFMNRYRDAIAALLGGPAKAKRVSEELGWNLPTLRAGLPPSEQELSARLAASAAESMQTYGDAITQSQIDTIQAEQKVELIRLLKDRAQQLDIYANPDIGPRTALNPAFPLSVRPYIYLGTTPEPWQMWESQIELWIQSDIIAAIAKANQAGQVVGQTQDGKDIYASVLTAPVKRLLLLEVLPGYVGLHTAGGVGSLNPTPAGTSAQGDALFSAGNRTGSRSTVQAAALTPPPAGAITDPASPIKLNYYFAPTGRRSNAVFDTRHVHLIVHIDYQKLPAFYKALGEVNFMSVVDAKFKAVDEFDFASLGGTYLYGTGDIVEAEFIIESNWLRDWTTPLMPQRTREYLGVDAAGGADAGAGDGSAMPNGMMGGM